jgi:hypothetical protein
MFKAKFYKNSSDSSLFSEFQLCFQNFFANYTSNLIITIVLYIITFSVQCLCLLLYYSFNNHHMYLFNFNWPFCMNENLCAALISKCRGQICVTSSKREKEHVSLNKDWVYKCHPHSQDEGRIRSSDHHQGRFLKLTSWVFVHKYCEPYKLFWRYYSELLLGEQVWVLSDILITVFPTTLFNDCLNSAYKDFIVLSCWQSKFTTSYFWFFYNIVWNFFSVFHLLYSW